MEPALPELSQYWLEQSLDADGRQREPARIAAADDRVDDEKALAELVERVNAARGVA